MDKYKDFDNQIFAITRVMLDLSLTDGQKAELRQVAGEIEQARQDGSLDEGSYQKLLDTLADVGLDYTPPQPEGMEQHGKDMGKKRPRHKEQER